VKRAIVLAMLAAPDLWTWQSVCLPEWSRYPRSSPEYDNRPFASRFVLAGPACSCKANRLARG
jgi:hypothetical protein